MTMNDNINIKVIIEGNKEIILQIIWIIIKVNKKIETIIKIEVWIINFKEIILYIEFFKLKF